jgi:hypothetical protein
MMDCTSWSLRDAATSGTPPPVSNTRSFAGHSPRPDGPLNINPFSSEGS